MPLIPDRVFKYQLNQENNHKRLYVAILVVWAFIVVGSVQYEKYKDNALFEKSVNITNGVAYCGDRQPCGWDLYIEGYGANRQAHCYRSNRCVCDPNLKCLRTVLDTTIHAVVYHCGPSSTNHDPMSTEDVVICGYYETKYI